MEMRCKILVILALMCVFFAQSGFAEEFQGYDTWFLLEFESTPAGVMNSTLSRVIEDGEVRYVMSQVIEQQLVAADGRSYEQSWMSEYHYNSNWERTSFVYMQFGLMDESIVHGVFHDDGLHLVITRNGDVEEKILPLPENYYDLSSTEALFFRRGELSIGETFTGHFFDENALEFYEVTVTVLDKTLYDDGSGVETEVYVFEMRSAGFVAETYIGMDGQMYLLVYKEPVNGTARRVDESVLSESVFVDGRRIVISTGEYIPRYSNIDYIKVRLNIIGGIPEELNLEDNRTEIVEERSLRSSSSITVAIRNETRDFVGSCEFPVYSDELEKYTSNLESLSEKDKRLFEAIAKDIVGSETDVWTACVKLGEWVNEYIAQPSDFMELSIPEFMGIQGVEHFEGVWLFTALARALEIPTKIVGGYIFAGSSYQIHFWNEIWVGEWVTFDLIQPGTFTSPLLLKIREVDDSFVTTTYWFYQLGGKLEIDVLEYTNQKDYSHLGLVTGVEDGVYTNAEVGFRISVPGEEWMILPTEENGQLMVFMTNLEKEIVVELFVIEFPVRGVTLDEYVEIMSAMLSAMISDYEPIGFEEIVVSGLPAYQREGIVSVEGQILKLIEVMTLDDTVAFYIMFLARVGTDKGYFHSIVESFEVF